MKHSREAAELMHSYAVLHLSKLPPQVDKAMVNIDMARKLYADLGEDYTPPDIALLDLPEPPAERLVIGCPDDVLAYIASVRDTARKNPGGEPWRILDTLHEALSIGIYERPIDPLRALQELIQEVGDHNIKAGWWTDATEDLRLTAPRHRIPFIMSKMMLAVTEIGEAVEGWRKSGATKTVMDDHLPDYPMVTVEIADAIIRLFDLAANIRLCQDNATIDVPAAYIAKRAYNAVRADHKPENRAKDGGKAV